MTAIEPFTPRPLDPIDLREADAVAAAAGVHGLYVRNAIADPRPPRADRVLGLYGRGGLLGLAFFGARGNLVLVADDRVDPSACAAALRGAGVAWRIALGAAPVLAVLAAAEPEPPLVDRTQVYYGVDRAAAVAAGSGDARLAERADARWLVAASIELNRVDLNVAPWRVNRGWLHDSVKRRIRTRRTWVVGELGAPACKLDVGSIGPPGAMVEGVFTRESARGRGLATGLVAAVAARLLADVPLVCLHVDEANTAARRCYERAGMVELGRCRLLLRR